MSQTRTRERAAPPLNNPFGMGGEVAPLNDEAASLPALMPTAGAGRASDNALAGVITAQRVAVKRDLGGILGEARSLGAAAGADFYYSIPYRQKDKDTGEFRTVYVEGPSIKAAMACASLYGNCRVGAQVSKETATHWYFQAVFQDLEKGTTVMREFQAQKPQEGRGRMDTARRADMDFQSAQSKAIRNVVVAAIPLVVDAAYQAARGSMLKKVEANPKGALEHALDVIDGLAVPVTRVERKMAKPCEKWTPREIVRVIMDAYSVRDGVMSAAEVWPPQPSDEQSPQQQAETVVQESAAAEAPTDAAEEVAEGSGQAEEEDGGRGAQRPSGDPSERRDDPPPPAAAEPETRPAAAAPAAQQQQRATATQRQPAKAKEPPPPAADAPPHGLDFGG